MNYHNITKCDMLNGDGLRVVLWVAGCDHHCPGCQNPITHDQNGGILFDEAAKAEIFKELSMDYCAGITFSGGDPFYQANIKTVLVLAKEIREKFPDKNIWSYTGYTLDEIMRDDSCYGNDRRLFASQLDVLVDGRYVEALRDADLHWVGSSNQIIHRLHFYKEKRTDDTYDSTTVFDAASQGVQADPV